MASKRPTIALSRRAVVLAALAAFAPPSQAQLRAPPAKVRLGYLGGSGADPMILRTQVEPLRKGLRELGYIEGQTITTELRRAVGNDELAAFAAELVHLNVAVIVSGTVARTNARRPVSIS